MKVATTKLPPPLDAKLEALSRRRGVSRSAVLREALARYVAGQPGSFADEAADLCGALRGPRDLATARGHLRGYGA